MAVFDVGRYRVHPRYAAATCSNSTRSATHCRAGSSMFTSLRFEMRIRPSLWRWRLAYWWADAKGSLPFIAMLALLLLGMLGIVCFAYLDDTRIEPVRLQAAQWEARHAQQRADDLECLAENIYFEAR